MKEEEKMSLTIPDKIKELADQIDTLNGDAPAVKKLLRKLDNLSIALVVAWKLGVDLETKYTEKDLTTFASLWKKQKNGGQKKT